MNEYVNESVECLLIGADPVININFREKLKNL